MTVFELLQEAITSNKVLMSIREKVSAGTATFADCHRFTILSSKILGDVLGDTVLDIPIDQRKAICVALMEERYDDITNILRQTQESIDAKANIAIRAVIPHFDTERAEQIGGSLTDETATGEVIQRRARAATATATKQVYDDYMRDNAEVRDRAGFKVEVIRTSVAGCCPWCSEVAGVYRYNDTPKDIWRRHDHCDCSIYYKSSTTASNLKGVGKRWVEVPETLHILKGSD